LIRVIVINTGTELLLGDVLNTHLVFIAQQILPLGLRVERQLTVPDGDAIRDALTETLPQADIIFVTGGLGPTIDDITREITAELLGLQLQHDATVMAAIAARAAARGFRLTDRIPRQAEVPAGATVLPNEFGTAPGLYLPENVSTHASVATAIYGGGPPTGWSPSASPSLEQPAGRRVRSNAPDSNASASAGIRSPHLFLLPGPPRELRPMFINHVMPLLRALVPATTDFASVNLHIAGVGESHVEEAIGAQLHAIAGLELGYCAKPGEVVVRLIGAKAVVEAGEKIVRDSLGQAIFATTEEPLEKTLVDLLTRRGQTVATAESCTGGLLGHRLTNVPGASAVFVEGIVAYANAAKTDLLGLPAELIEKHGAVSAEAARAMAQGVQKRAGSTYGLSTTGIAGPGGGTPDKPVGTVFIGISAAGAAPHAIRDRFPSDRETFKELVTQTALDLLRRRLL
jgi:nicotinamide-nucleotide amidase